MAFLMMLVNAMLNGEDLECGLISITVRKETMVTAVTRSPFRDPHCSIENQKW